VSDPSPKSRGLMSLFRRTEAPPPPATGDPTAEPSVAGPLDRDAGAEPPAEPPKKQSWFQRLKAGLTKTSARLSEDIAGLFTKRKLDADSLQELEDLLIQADLGVETAMRITEALAKGRYNKEIAPEEVRAVLAAEVERTLAPVAKPLRLDGQHRPHVILVVGVNGTGKTTTIGKLARKLTGEGKKVTLAAGDTFRAAAVEQLQIWGERTGADVIARAVGADSAGLAYDALGRARENGSDVLLIDTAGRLQNKQALMDELDKVIRVLRKLDPLAPHQVLLVLDATTGQNALNQVEIFKEKAGVTGLVMTKLDGTARGGILVAISAKFGLPVHAIGIGEGVEDLAGFDANEFARAIALS
jgi:fused signal recognition particle receptor